MRLERDCLQPTNRSSPLLVGSVRVLRCLWNLPAKTASIRGATVTDDSAYTPFARLRQFRNEPGRLLRMGRALLSDGFAVFVCWLHTAKPEMIRSRGNLAFAARTHYVARAILVGAQK